MRVIDANELERLEDELEQFRRTVRESADAADRVEAGPSPSPRLVSTLALALFALLAFLIGRTSGAELARASSCKPLPSSAEAQLTLKTPDRTFMMSTDGEIVISNDNPTCTTVRRRKVTPSAVRALVDRLATSCFFQMNASYTSPSDGLVNELTVRAGARVNAVRHPVRSWGTFVGGCALPHELLRIEADVITLATKE